MQTKVPIRPLKGTIKVPVYGGADLESLQRMPQATELLEGKNLIIQLGVVGNVVESQCPVIQR